MKEFCRIYFCIEEQVEISSLILDIHQMRQDLIQEPFSLVGAADGKTPQGVGKAASGGNDLVIFIKHGAGIVQVGIPLYAFLF